MADRLKSLRLAASLTQAAVAKRVGVSQRAISFWEQGVHAPRIQTLVRLADLFDVSLEELVNDHNAL